MENENKKRVIRPDLSKVRIIENPYLEQKERPCVIEKPEDVNAFWDEFGCNYIFGDLKVLCELNLEEYSIVANSICSVKPISVKNITCDGDIMATSIKADEINCSSIIAEDVYANKLSFSGVCSINTLSVIELDETNPKAKNKCKKITKR